MVLVHRFGWLSVSVLCLLAVGPFDTCGQEPVSAAPPTFEELEVTATALDASDFTERENASARIEELAVQHGSTVRDSLISIYKSSSSPEVRYRIYSILLNLAQGVRPDAKPGFLGIMMMDSKVTLPDGTNATSIIVRQVVAGSAAARSGLQPSDHIVAVDGKKMKPGTSTTDTASSRFSEYIRSKAAQAEVELEVYSARKRKLSNIRITLGERPDKYEDPRYKKNLANDVVKGWLGDGG